MTRWVFEGYSVTMSIMFNLKAVHFADFVILNAIHNYFSFCCVILDFAQFGI